MILNVSPSITLSTDIPSLYNNLDSTSVLIGLQVCFHSAMKQENDVRNIVDCLRVVIIYISSFSLLILKIIIF